MKIALLGAGTMGHGIAQTAAVAGFYVVLRDINDAANGTTRAAFHCGHWPCAPAYTLPGDARHLAAQERAYLRADAADWRVEAIAPLASPHLAQPIATAYAGPFEPTGAGPRLVPLLVAPVLLAAGAGFALRARGPLAPALTTMGAGVGVLAGMTGAQMGEGGLLVLGLGVVVGLGSLALLLSTRTRLAGIALALAAVSAVWTLLTAQAWFPSPPAV